MVATRSIVHSAYTRYFKVHTFLICVIYKKSPVPSNFRARYSIGQKLESLMIHPCSFPSCYAACQIALANHSRLIPVAEEGNVMYGGSIGEARKVILRATMCLLVGLGSKPTNHLRICPRNLPTTGRLKLTYWYARKLRHRRCEPLGHLGDSSSDEHFTVVVPATPWHSPQ